MKAGDGEVEGTKEAEKQMNLRCSSQIEVALYAWNPSSPESPQARGLAQTSSFQLSFEAVLI